MPTACIIPDDVSIPLLAHLALSGRPSEASATHELLPVGSDQDVEEARRLMTEHHLDRVLVVQGDRLVGIVSEADVRSDEAPLA